MDNLNFNKLLILISKWKYFLIFWQLLFTMFSIFFIASLNNIYQSTATVIPKNLDSTSNVGSGLSSITAIANIDIGNQGKSMMDEYITYIESRDFFAYLIEKQNLLPYMHAIKLYDPISKTLVIDNSKYLDEEDILLVETTFEDSYKLFHEKYLTINKNVSNNFIKISFHHESPKFAKEVLEAIIFDADSFFRERAIVEFETYIEFLNDQLSKTNLLDLKQNINSLLSSQIESLMLAQSPNYYVINVLDKPNLADKKILPYKVCLLLLQLC